MIRSYFKKISDYAKRHERRISSAALLAGFIIDTLTLRRVDYLIENLILISYIVIAAVGIFILNVYAGGKLKGKLLSTYHHWLPIIIQFAFGGLFSGFVVFYYRSANLSASWPFILILVIMLVGNEAFKKFYQRMSFQIATLFFALFVFSIFYIPVLIRKIGSFTFILSGIVSVLLISVFIFLLYKVIPLRIKESKKYIFISITSIFLIINVFYFLNIIPPIPLSLKDAGPYHSIERTQGGYSLMAEDAPPFSFFKSYPTLHIAPTESVSVYSAIFAPTDLNTEIVHHWQFYDENRKGWVSSSRVSFPIVGGREAGYRGYSTKSNIFKGKWRVDVETTRGQRIGRVKFRIERVPQQVPLTTIIKP